MFLKALTLKGFKSFAETTTLEMQPGVTVVVGPNGSGKSNVVDAIGWVLGAQAPSTVRSLAATEGTVVRLGDLLREVRRQLRPLERQAGAARRHGDLVTELRALHVFVTGRELATLKRRLGDTTAARAELRNEQTLLERRLAELDTAVLAAEARLDPLGGSEVGDALAKVEALREKARGQLAVLAERRRGVDRERAAFVDQAVVASLEADSAQLRTDLVAVDHESEALEPDATALAAAEAALADARQGFEHEWADGVPTPSGRAAEVRGELVALRTALARAAGDHERSQSRAAALRSGLERLDRELAGATDEIAAAQAAEPALVAAAEAAGERRAAAEAAVAAAERRRDETQAERHAWVARREALELALDEARARAGAERLATVYGVVGTLLDLIDVDPGWEPAVEAACGEALAAVVVDSVASARRALHVLADGDVSGAVLAVGAGGGSAPAPPAAPPVGEPVLAHVRPRRPDVGALLDALLGSAVAIDGGWAAAVDATLAHPDAVVVTRQGGRFGLTGWRVSTATTRATGNALDEARDRAATAIESADAAVNVHHRAGAALEKARATERMVVARLDEMRRSLAAATAAQARAAADRDDAADERVSLARQQGDDSERLARDRARAAELAADLPGLEAEEAELQARASAMADDRRSLDERAAAVAAERAELERRRTALADRRAFLRQRLSEVEERLAGSVAARRDAEERRVELDATELALDRLAAFVGDRLALTQQHLADLQERRRRETDAQRALSAELTGLRRERSDKERTLAERRERAQRVEIDEAEVRLRLEQAIETCRTQLDVEPEAAIQAEQPELPDGATPTVRARELERELRVMGPINPLALEEFDALSERHSFLTEQLDDVKSSRRELNKVIRAIDEEIVRVFAAAFADVSENFEQLFATLFPGGHGRLRLTDPDDLLNTGVEVDAKPSGKNVKKLSLLSGGERSLTALAYLFAVFRSRPSPFYVMDEVEAALDDVNLHRFLDLVAEFRREAQLIVVTHQKRTMEAADCLYGVTMQTAGSSKVVSETVAAGA